MSTLPVAWPSPVSINAAGPVATVLSAVAAGRTAQVREVQAAGATGERLLEMGLTPGTPVRVLRRGFLGGPLVVEVRGYVLSLGNGQAQQIQVMPQG